MTQPPPLIYVECELPEGVTLSEWRRRARGAPAAPTGGRARRARARLARLGRRGRPA